jgi:hypothetical protein
VTGYLKADDGIIDSAEYKELITLMAKMKVSKELSGKLREKRLNGKEEKIDFKSLISKLDKMLKKNKADTVSIHQSLFFDLLQMRQDNLEKWSDDKDLMNIAKLLSINEKQIEVGVVKIQTDRKIIEERMEDSQIKEMTKEFVALAGGAGVTLAALAVTGGVSTGIWGGLLTLGFMSTGGMMLGLAAIGGLGYGAYRGIKYFSGTSELEKSGIRVAALQSAIENNKRATTYIIDDINALTTQISKIFNQLKDSAALNNELMEKLANYINYSKNIGKSGELLNEDSSKANYEIHIARIPQILPLAKFEELVNTNPNRVQIKEYVMSIYTPVKKENEDGDIKTVYERSEEISYDDAEKLDNILETIGFYDTKSSAMAQTSVLAKKGIDAIKGLLG